MIIPKIQGNLSQDQFFIYIACDVHYFNNFGKSIINSIKQNSNCGIHVHLYNPSDDQIKYCENSDRVSLTYELVPLDLFEPAANRWLVEPTNAVDQLNYKRIITAMSKSDDVSIVERIQRTYYACARFIRLAELINSNTEILAIDADAIVRSNIPALPQTHDFYIHQITGPKARFLAGGIYLNGHNNGYNFITEYANVLKNYILSDTLHWGIDQDLLDGIVPNYNFGVLPMPYIDWNMSPDSYIWTAKGKRKEMPEFINEQMKYNF